MTRSFRLGPWLDVKATLDQALASGGGSLVLATDGAATHWRHRAYTFRKKYYEATGDGRYDTLRLPRIQPGSNTVVIEIAQARGLFIPGDAGPAETDNAAEELARKLGLGDLL